MTKKIISPAAINALKEALTNIYWYKNDLRTFIHNCIVNPQILSTLNWEDYKRNIVSNLVDFMVKNQAAFKNDLLNLMAEVIKINDFTHLVRLDDGKEKALRAKESVLALKKIYNTHDDVISEKKNIEARKKEAEKQRSSKEAVKRKLSEIKGKFYDLVSSSNPQSRGYELEKILKELFTLFDLDPKSSFKLRGEQLDGAFTFDNTDFLLEAKWQKSPVGIQDLDAFEGKILRKLDNVLGLFISIYGYSDDAVKLQSTGRSLIILMDGSDLVEVLEGRIDLKELLLLKRRHASQTGNIYLKIKEINSN